MAVVAEGDVAEAEEGGFVLGSSVAVSAGPHEEVEYHPNDAFNALCFGVDVDVVLEDIVQDGGGERFDPFWRRVRSSVSA